MSDRFRSCLISPAVTLVVALAVLWGSLFAPSHATAMALSAAAIIDTDHAKPPCPMSMGHHAHDSETDGHAVSDGDNAKGMPGDMHCCPALALSPSQRFADVSQAAIDVPLQMGVIEPHRFGAPGIEPRPPRS